MTRDDLKKELDGLWKEKTEAEILTPEEEFVPGTVVEESKPEDVLIKIVL